MEGKVIFNTQQIHPSKASLAGIVTSLTLRVMDEEESAIEQATKLDFIIKACTKAKEDIRSFVLDELEKDKEKKEYFGYRVEPAEVGTTWDYSRCNDKVYIALEAKMAKLKDEMKDREAFLKSIKSSETLVDEETGEVVRIYPPVKRSTSSAKFTLL
jgi:hypothetical protein